MVTVQKVYHSSSGGTAEIAALTSKHTFVFEELDRQTPV